VKVAIDFKADANEIDELTFPKIMVVYEDVPAGQNAVRLLAGMFQEPAEKLELRPQLWQFALLEDSGWFGKALADAINADVVVITTSAEHGMNKWVESWVRSCLQEKRGTTAAVVALLGPAESLDGPDSPRYQSLQDAVRKVGLEFFAPQSLPETAPNEISWNTLMCESFIKSQRDFQPARPARATFDP
jgi:hypothetical protein